MARRPLFPLLCALALALAAPAAADLSERKESVDSQLAAIQSEIARAQQQEVSLGSEIASVSSEIRALEQRVGDVSSRLSALERDLELHQRKLDRLTELFRLQTERLEFLRRQYGVAIERLNRRLVAIYQQDDPEALDVLVNARSFSDLLEQLDFVRDIGAQDKRISESVRGARDTMRVLRLNTARTKARVAAVTRVIAIRTAQQRSLRDRLVANKRGLESRRGAKEAALEAIQSSAHQHASEAAVLSRLSSSLGSRIRNAQIAPQAYSPVQSIAAPDSSPSASGFVWPVSGPVVSPFGWRWGRMHEGIDIGAGSGAPIVAAASGTVVSAGWMGGYGNLIVIDHGGGVATAYAHQSSFAAGSGQHVSQGQLIGYVGCTGHCYGPHLHFEVRVNGAAVDPLGYL